MYKVLDICHHVVNYSNNNDYGISNLKLQKILYFIQAYFVMNTTDHSACFEERIEAWDFGPVVPTAYHAYKHYGSGDIPSVVSYFEFDEDSMWGLKAVKYEDSVISVEHKMLIDSVVDGFKDFSATDLVTITHRQAPWKNAYVPHMNNEITIAAIREYFNGK